MANMMPLAAASATNPTAKAIVQIKAKHRAAHSHRELTALIGSLSAGSTLSNIGASHLNKSDVGDRALRNACTNSCGCQMDFTAGPPDRIPRCSPSHLASSLRPSTGRIRCSPRHTRVLYVLLDSPLESEHRGTDTAPSCPPRPSP